VGVSPSSLLCYFTQCDAVKLVKNFFGVKDIHKARQRLDRLLQEEGRAVEAQTLMTVKGEWRFRLVIRRVLNTFPFQDNKASTDGVRNVLGTSNVLLAIAGEFRV